MTLKLTLEVFYIILTDAKKSSKTAQLFMN